MTEWKKVLPKGLIFVFFLLVVGERPVCAQSVPGSSGQRQGVAEIESASEQSRGINPVQKLDYITAYGMQQKAWNNPLEHLGEGQSRPGYSKYSWRKDLVLPIRLREAMMTLINFPSWEVIEEVWIGSADSFSSEIASPNSLVLSVEPDMIGVDSNMIVFGRSGNRYAFYLRSEAYNTDRITHSVVDIMVRDKDIPDGVLGVRSKGGKSGKRGKGTAVSSSVPTNAPIDWLENIDVNPEAFRFDVDVFIPNPADISWAPDRVWRDEIFTYIDLGKKVLSSNERPIVNLLIQESEVPVGFRTRGPNGRLIVVEAVGDMVLRNGQRLICLKLRKDPSYGLDRVDYAPPKDKFDLGGNYKGQIPMTSDKDSSARDLYSARNAEDGDYTATENYRRSDTMNYLYSGDKETGSEDVVDSSNIALELGTSEDIAELESLWDNIYKTNSGVLKGIEPYFSIDAKVDTAKDVFHLRAGPIKEIPFGEHICVVLGKSGFKCSVIKTQ